ncbi:hypothetical protein PR048_028357 [Dryococelus australis]|uniref:Integrase zinc-binding domain-containing protein n=1 Tax=Dryococelus australis TaxID=614101 RepID=A0ABQ9GJ16_9NEOP|nr:hypothetical protein PR048_028357 [Dryococelus australis]
MRKYARYEAALKCKGEENRKTSRKHASQQHQSAQFLYMIDILFPPLLHQQQRMDSGADSDKWRVYVPTKAWDAVSNHTHTCEIAGHPGGSQIKQNILKHFHWQGTGCGN